jgi:von Willebrand factor type A domain
MTQRRIALAGALSAILLSLLAISPWGAAARRASSAVACSPATNIEAIIDDSGSMSITDPNRLRVQALDLLINTPGNEKTTLGAVEFGGSFLSSEPSADTVFPPELIGGNQTTMATALDTKIKADNGLTDYNAAFAQAQADNPNARARIFLTDGGHDAGTYNNGHRGGPPTYVIGFGSATAGEDGQRLQQIANETAGKYFPQTDSSNLQAVMNEVDTTLTCQSAPKTFKDAFTKVGQSKPHAVVVTPGTRSLQLTLTWGSPLDTFTIVGLKIVRHGKTVAVISRRHKLSTSQHQGSTFLVLRVSRLVRGTLRFKVRASRIGSGAPRVNLTTQVSQSRRG